MRKKLGILILFFPILFAVACAPKTEANLKCIAVHDGDTFTLEGNKIIRLYGVDTPEVSNQFNDFNPTSGIEGLYGAEATEFTSNMILNHIVKYMHITNDPYGRDVARIQYDSKDLSLELVKAGLARVAYISIDPKDQYYTSDYSYYRELLDAQYQAHINRVGFWLHQDQFKTIFPKAV